MSIDWENILPEKWSTDEPHCDAFNRCRYESLNALKAAETRGEICKPLSVSEIREIILEVEEHKFVMRENGIRGKTSQIDLAQAIHNAQLSKERNEQ
ncbi:MAG TPA: hypothetical protein PLZ78_09030 [Spirochaetota bacterium]|nr:hypothetical protein [Spirochaetota bacterium]